MRKFLNGALLYLSVLGTCAFVWLAVSSAAAAGALQLTCPSGAICLGSGDQRPVYFIQDGIVRAGILSDGAFRTYPGGQTTATGSSTSAIDVGTISTDTTQAGTAADLVETNLWTYTLKGNVLSANGRGVRIFVGGSLGANANNKTIKVYFGATQLVALSTTANGSGWQSEVWVFRTGAATQRANGNIMIGLGNVQVTQTAPAETLSGDVVIRMTGQNGIANANDIVYNVALVEVF